jgi:hypothetical protein
MKKERIFLAISFVLILILIFSLDFKKPNAEGKIVKIIPGKSFTSIALEDNSLKIYVQNTTSLKIKKGNKIQIYGAEQKNINETILFVDKIVCLDCKV